MADKADTAANRTKGVIADLKGSVDAQLAVSRVVMRNRRKALRALAK